MQTFRFLDFPVYQRAKHLHLVVLDLTTSLKHYALKNQAERASLSVLLNIAEGSAKKSDKDFARFIQISLGSINELYACLDMMQELKYISVQQFSSLATECTTITKQLGGLIKKLNDDNR